MYTIKENLQYNSREIYFDAKPAAEVLSGLRGLKMRWNPRKGCWYGFAAEHTIIETIQQNTPEDKPGTIYTDGYLGGGAVYGAKSNRHLYGAELSAAIRQDLKKAGLKGCFVRSETYAGGQAITVTVKIPVAEYKTADEFITTYKVPCGGWITLDDGETVLADRYFALETAEEQEAMRKEATKNAYKFYLRGYNANQHCLSKDDFLNNAGLEKIIKINDIITAYRYDASNGMVDYFDTNFYYDINIIPLF